MNCLRIGIAIGSLLILNADCALGQRTRPISVVVSGGATVPTGGFKDYHDLGIHGDVGLILSLFGQSLRLRPELTYTRFNVKDALGRVYGASATSATSATSASNTVSGMLGARPPARTSSYGDVSTLLGAFGNVEVPVGPLYLIAGVGAVDVKTAVTTTGAMTSETKVALNGGAGVRFHLGPIAGFVEGRLSDVSLDKGRSQFRDVKTIPVTFGVVF